MDGHETARHEPVDTYPVVSKTELRWRTIQPRGSHNSSYRTLLCKPGTGRMRREVLHSTETRSKAHTVALQKSAVPWPSVPLVEWPPELLELYFDWLLVEWEGVVQ